MLSKQELHPYIHYYIPTFLTAALAYPIWLLGGGFFALAPLFFALISYLFSRSLIRSIVKTTEQKCHLDEQLIQSQKLAAIGELSSGIAHEINNPLAIIGQEIEWMRHVLKEEVNGDSKGIEDLTDSMQEIARQVDRCREITHKLLDFARKKDPLIQNTEINKLIEDMVKLVEKEAVHKNIQIIREYRQDLPQIYTDPPLLRQVILNLLNNATYAIGKDGHITVTTALSESRTLDIGIRDTGCGIPGEDLNKIFDPFFTTKPPGKGTGLGLSICHGIIERLGGKISVESEMNCGTTFTLHLPIDSKRGEK